MNIRRICVLAALPALFAAPAALAVPAWPGLHTLHQPDGTAFQARQWGDERVHGWETADGYAIVRDKSAGTWNYAVRDASGALAASSRAVGSGEPPAQKRLRPTREAIARVPAMGTPAQRKLVQAMGVKGPQRAIATTGNGYLVTVLVNFNDTASTYSNAQFTNLVYGAAGSKSVKDFYREMSHGAYSLQGTVKGWYNAAQSHDYYGANTGVNETDAKPGTLVREAVAALEAADPLFDWAPYDQDHDCYVDSISFIHQGTGEEEQTDANDIWSHSWDLDSAFFFGASDGGAYSTHTACAAGGAIKVNAYVIQPEKSGTGMTTIGVIAHEYGHALGLPDLYDTDYSSEGVGQWSLMAGGSWNYVARAGDSPAHLDAWSKYALGWATPTNVSGTLTGEAIQAASAANDIYKLGNGTATSGEYFLVENRQLSGFDAGLPGAGLMIWHVDTSQADNNSECMPGYCPGGHYKVALVQADNVWDLEAGSSWGGNGGDATDPYYQGNNAGFGAATSPDSNWWDGSASTASVVDISASAATMTATLTFNSADTPPIAAADAYTVSGTLAVTADIGVLVNDSDADGDTLTAVLATGPAHGTLTLNADGSFTYTPDSDYTGADSFTYSASDGIEASAPATVTLTVARSGGGGGGGGALAPLALLLGIPFALRRRR